MPLVRRWLASLLIACAVPTLAPAQTISTVAGVGRNDGGAATSATLFSPRRVSATSSALYVSDVDGYRLRRISTSTGIITSHAGKGMSGSSGDGAAATLASVRPSAAAIDASGNAYIADWTNNRIRRVSASTGLISTIAGNGSGTYAGDGGPATAAGLDPIGIAVDASGNLYIADYANHRVRKIAAATGIITTVAGNGTGAYAGDGGAATSASLYYPADVALDGSGNLYIADAGNNRIRKVTAATGVITTIAGSATAGFAGDGGTATAAQLDMPFGVALDGAGNVYIADTNNSRVRKVTGTVITTIAGNGLAGYAGDGVAATTTSLGFPEGVAIDSSGNVLIADTGNRRVRRVSTTGTITTIAGVGVANNVAATSAGLYSPRGLAIDASGNVYFADFSVDRVRKVTAATGLVTTVAGPGTTSFCGDGGPGTSACLEDPIALAIDASNNVYIADYSNSRVRKLTVSSGVITTVAGNGQASFAGDGGLATAAALNLPQGIAIGPNGDLYIADTSNARVRKVSAANGVITTVAGTGTRGYSGDGGAAISARLDWPTAVAVDASGNLYIADANDHRVRKVTAASGVITTVAGNGVPGFVGDGGPATAAHLNYPNGVTVDAQGNLYISDTDNYRVRRVSAATGVITTVAGNGNRDASGNGGPAPSAGLSVWQTALDTAGNLVLADYENGMLRRVAKDATSPETSITTRPDAASTSNQASFTFAITDAGGPAIFQCSLDGGAFVACAGSVTFNNLSIGSHTLQVRALDGWGNVDATPETYTWTITQAATRASITAGMFYECGNDQNGALACWGDNGSGKLGTGEAIQSTVPTAVGGLATSLVAIGASQNHTCSLTSTGDVLCWGGNYFGELGNGTFTSSGSPTKVKDLPAAASAIAVGIRHNCALVSGNVYCWGMNRSGQLGNGEVSDLENTAVKVQGLAAGVTAIAAGGAHSCAIGSTGSVSCWGDNSAGQLGDGTTTQSSLPRTVTGLPGPVVSLSLSENHSCAVTSTSQLYCWGQNTYGQLGTGTTTSAATATRVPFSTTIRSVAAGSFYTCAITTGSALYCWGTNYFDTLATGAATNALVSSPTIVSALASGVSGISAGRTHACAAKHDGTVYCWGYNAYGAIGDGSTTDRKTPTQVRGLAASSIVAAGNLHSCALNSAKRAMCWGYNAEGQLGGGTKIGRATPQPVAGFPQGAQAIQAGIYHTCALNVSGGVSCWGQNFSGQLGNDSEVGSSSPVAVQGLSSGVASLAVGGRHSCAATATGQVFCWGDNSGGQLGVSGVSRTPVPVEVEYLGAPVVSLSAGWSYTCAATSAGTVYCWGTDTHGALGNGNVNNSIVPLRVPIPATVTAISGGLYHQCALTGAGAIWCWGNNLSGQLGIGSYVNSRTPAQVVGLPAPMAKVSAGQYNTCAVSNTGAAYCWGYGGGGQIGDGYLSDASVPIAVPSLASGIADIASGDNNCAMTDTGVVYCWGESNFGQIGDGAYVTRTKPVIVIARNGAGALDTNDWYLDLIPSKSKVIASQFTPKMLAVSQLSLAGDGSALDSTLKYKTSEFGRGLNNYVFALVPAEFFGMVKTAPGAASVAQLKAKYGKSLVFAQLTPLGWTNAQGQLIAYSTGVANAAGSAANILNGVRLDLVPGARFCVGYGSGASDMLTADTFREVLVAEGASSTVEGRACVLSGVYLDGPRSSRAGSAVTFTASVVGIAPTGQVQFKDGALALLAPVALVDSGNEAVRRASITTSSLAAGTHSILASYPGDGAQNPAADSAILVHEVAAAVASTRVDLVGPHDSVQGTSVQFSATVTGANPTGTVQFFDGAASLGAAVPLLSGGATLRVDGLAVGSHSITAAYSGDGANAAASSTAIVHSVYEARSTTITLASSANPAAYGAAVSFTATVQGSNPTGQVTFREGSTVLARATLSGNSASATVTGLAAGTHFIEADYAGDGANQAVTSAALAQLVNAPTQAAAPNVFLASSFNPSMPGQSVAFTITVSGSGATATGSVTVKEGAASLCTATLSSGAATCAVSTLAAGVHLLTASYSGDGTYASAVSSVLSQTVADLPRLLTASPAAIDFGSQAVNTTSATRVVTFTNATASAVSLGTTSLPAGVIVTTPNTCSGSVAAGASCQVGFAFRPTAVGNVAASIVLAYAGGATGIAVTGAGEKSLVAHYYRSILRREPDAAGKAYWESEAARVASLGANVNETWFAMALSFYGSAEYQAFGRNSTDYVRDLYATFFNRAPEDAGLAYWTGLVAQGLPREVVLSSFMFSPEFVGFAQAIFGNTAVRAEVDTVVDFYRGLLARLPDSAGFNYWVGQFRAAQCQGAGAVYTQVETISSAYANSPEYGGRNRNNTQFVSDLYNTFLRRGGDLDGVKYWIGQLDTGARSRDNVRQAFIASPEFSARVQAVIAQGCLQ